MSTKILEVVYQSDDNYILASAASMTSLLENNQHLQEIIIYYVGYEISQENRKRMELLLQNYANASLVYIDAAAAGYNEIFKNLPGTNAWNDLYITWYKLIVFGEQLFQTDRILYLNPHTIVNKGLDNLLELDFENNMMALSYDCLMIEHKKAIGLPEEYGYHNCGVMLINREKWVKDGATQAALSHLAQPNEYIIVDQDFCNIFFKDSIKLIGPEFNYSSAYYAYPLKTLLEVNHLNPTNYYSYKQLMAEYYSPVIIHSSFGLTGKPWEKNNQHPNGPLWDKYIDLSPWKDYPRPIAKKTMAWSAYRILPRFLFMQMYRLAVQHKLRKG